MSFPRYERYKDSGVEWLGEVPEHWDVLPLKRAFTIIGGSTPSSEIEIYWGEGCVWVTPADLSKITDQYISQSERTITVEGLKSCSSSMVPVGSIVLSTRAPIGSLAIAGVELCTNQGCKSLVPMPGTVSSAYAFLLSILSEELQIRGKGTTFLEISADVLGSVKVPRPSTEEQKLISKFLETETAKIDALIEEQRRLIDLLKEKRQAAISLAVTKGINAGVPMEWTGDRWLGSIPDHWAVVGAKFVSTIFVPQRNKPELNREGDGIPWITMDQMKEVEVATSGYWVSQEAAQAAGTRTLNKGAVIASCVGNFGTASVNLCDVVINQQLQAFIPNDRIRTSFLRYRVESAKSYFEQIGTAATIPYVNQQGFASMPVPLPPLSEQDTILAHLDKVTSDIDQLLAQINDAMVILAERRSALISAAVTGKIDVRKYTPKEAA